MSSGGEKRKGSPKAEARTDKRAKTAEAAEETSMLCPFPRRRMTFQELIGAHSLSLRHSVEEGLRGWRDSSKWA